MIALKITARETVFEIFLHAFHAIRCATVTALSHTCAYYFNQKMRDDKNISITNGLDSTNVLLKQGIFNYFTRSTFAKRSYLHHRTLTNHRQPLAVSGRR